MTVGGFDWRIMHFGRDGILRRGGGVSMVIVTMVALRRGSRMPVVGRVAIIVLAVRRRSGMLIVAMVSVGRGVTVIIVTMCNDRSGMSVIVATITVRSRMGGGVILTLAGFRAMTRVVAVIVVRLVLVAHCDSVPQPLSAVFAAKSV